MAEKKRMNTEWEDFPVSEKLKHLWLHQRSILSIHQRAFVDLNGNPFGEQKIYHFYAVRN